MTRISIWTDRLDDRLVAFTNHLNLNEYSYKIINKLDDDSLNYPLMIYFDQKNKKNILEHSSKFNHKVVLLVSDENELNEIVQLPELNQFVFGVINLNSLQKETYKIVQSYLELNFNYQDTNIEQSLEEIKRNTINELESIKSLFEKIVKPRVDKLKNVKVVSKFSSGLSAGGEFFDCINGDENMYVYFKTTSYVHSSELINAFEKIKLSFPNDKVAELENEFEKYKENISYAILKFDSKNRKIKSLTRGKFRLFLNNVEVNMQSADDLKVESFDKVTFVSEGFLENWKRYYPDMSLSSTLNENTDLSSPQKIAELFYLIYKKREERFHVYDSLISIFEFDFENNVEKLKKS